MKFGLICAGFAKPLLALAITVAAADGAVAQDESNRTAAPAGNTAQEPVADTDCLDIADGTGVTVNDQGVPAGEAAADIQSTEESNVAVTQNRDDCIDLNRNSPDENAGEAEPAGSQDANDSQDTGNQESGNGRSPDGED